MSSPQKTHSRQNNFDALRLALALLVVYAHSFPLGLGEAYCDQLVGWTNQQIGCGSLAVWSFFALSGYLIFQSWDNSRNIITYLRKRVSRIYPGFILACVLSYWFLAPCVSVNYRTMTWRRFAWDNYHMLWLSSPQLYAFEKNPYPNAINGSLWTINVEFACYLLLLVAGVCGLLRWRHGSLLLFVYVLLLRLNLEYPYLPSWVPGSSILLVYLSCVLFFASGMVFYQYRQHLIPTGLLAGISLAIFIAACVQGNLLFLVAPLTMTCMLLYLANAPWLRLHGAAKYGDLSYGVYLYAFPISQTIVWLYGSLMNPYLLCAATIPLSLLAAFLSWHLLEKRFLSPSRVQATEARPNELTTAEQSVNAGT